MSFRKRTFDYIQTEIGDEADLTRWDDEWRRKDGVENPIKTAAALEFI